MKLLQTSLLALLLTTIACNNATFTGKNGEKSEAGHSDVGSEDGKRPTDNGEGVPGFLVDPEKINVDAESGRVTGSVGAIIATGSNPLPLDHAQIIFWTAKMTDVQKQADKSQSGTIPATRRSDLHATKEGGFEADATFLPDLDEDSVFVVTAGPDSDRSQIDLTLNDRNSPSAVYYNRQANKVQALFPNPTSVEINVAATEPVADESQEYYWHLSELNQSCTEACSPFGGTHEATITVVGHLGSKAACESLARSFNLSFNVVFDVNPFTPSAGCSYEPIANGLGYTRVLSVTQDARDQYGHRFCACLSDE